MTKYSREQLLEAVFLDDYKNLKGKTLRLTRVRVPGKEVCFANICVPADETVFHNLALDIGVHEGEIHLGEAVGIMKFTPWESVVVAADTAMKAAEVEIGFMDRFCGSLIITGKLTQVQTAVKEVVRFFDEELSFNVCKVCEN